MTSNDDGLYFKPADSEFQYERGKVPEHRGGSCNSSSSNSDDLIECRKCNTQGQLQLQPLDHNLSAARHFHWWNAYSWQQQQEQQQQQKQRRKLQVGQQPIYYAIPDRTIHNYRTLKNCQPTFRYNIEFLDRRILRLQYFMKYSVR